MLLLPGMVFAQEVARVFEVSISATQLPTNETFYRARTLLSIVWKEVERRFVVENGVEATEADFAALAEYTQAVRKARLDYYVREVAEAEAGLQSSWLALPWYGDKRRRELEMRKTSFQGLVENWKNFPPPTGRSPERIVAAKAQKLMYDKYGGVVGINLGGDPYPLGARMALLRKHEQAGELRIMDGALREMFWQLAERPAERLAKPEEIDFTYFWLKPVPKRYSDPKNAP